jgi:hypothetical protein
MYAGKFSAIKSAARNERILVLANLIVLGDVRVKIVFAVKLCKVGKLTAESHSNL